MSETSEPRVEGDPPARRSPATGPVGDRGTAAGRSSGGDVAIGRASVTRVRTAKAKGRAKAQRVPPARQAPAVPPDQRTGTMAAGTTPAGTTPAGTNVADTKVADTMPAAAGAAGTDEAATGGAAIDRTRAASAADRERRRSPLWAKLLVAAGAVLMVAGVGTAVGVRVLVDRVSRAIPTEHLLTYDDGPTGAAIPVPTGSTIDGSINMLLIGLDTRVLNPSMGSRSDTIIIAHIPPTHDRVYLVSIPRDTWVSIPGHGSSKINAAFMFGSQNGGGKAGGTSLLAETIRSRWGITFQAAAIIQFGGFKDVVRKLGGVRMYVDERTVSLHQGFRHGTTTPALPFVIHSDGTRGSAIRGVDPVIYEIGWHDFTPKEALDFVRSRDGLIGTDYARQRHQQQFIKALLVAAYEEGLSDPSQLTRFLGSIAKAFVFDPGKASIADWIFTLKSINPNAIVTIKTNAGTYYSAHVSGTSAEAMSPTSLKLLTAVRNDTLAAFLRAHPTWRA